MPETAEGQEVRALFGVAEVEGPSMVPTLHHGDALLVRYGARVRPGDVVVMRHPLQQNLLIVKRAVERREGGWWVLADNPAAGSDSTVYGVVPDELVLGRVLLRYRPRPRPEGAGGTRPAAGERAGAGGARGRAARASRQLRPLTGLVPWALSAVRPVLGRSARSGRSEARRLRAR